MALDISLTPRDRQLIIWVFSALIIIVFVFLVMPRLLNAHASLEEADKAVQEKVQQATDPSLTLALEHSAETTNADVANLLDGYYPKMDSAQVTSLCQDIASEYGLTILDLDLALPEGYAASTTFGSTTSSGSSTDLTPQTGDLEGLYQTNVELTFSSSQQSLQDFINGLASDSFPAIRIISYTWEENSLATSSDEDDWELTIRLALYSYSDQE